MIEDITYRCQKVYYNIYYDIKYRWFDFSCVSLSYSSLIYTSLSQLCPDTTNLHPFIICNYLQQGRISSCGMTDVPISTIIKLTLVGHRISAKKLTVEAQVTIGLFEEWDVSPLLRAPDCCQTRPSSWVSGHPYLDSLSLARAPTRYWHTQGTLSVAR